MPSTAQRYLVIHGHFYQPPRENPWTEAIERQPSAAPYHDWNERVAAECYHPNAFSRILSPYQERIADIVNNYASISFNFGPTLLAWLARHDPTTYERILAADRLSVERFSGHGNAIAQAYNHMILPLANERDQVTQVRWGLADFRHRFGRDPESLWLPETAVNQTTLRILCDHRLRFLILSPYQAERVRPLDGRREWKEVGNGGLETSRPYRCFAPDAAGRGSRKRYIDIFFYHGDLSRGIAFEHILRDARVFAERIEASYPTSDRGPALVSAATDGESYGHHEPFGDMGLAYLLHVEAARRELQVTNFGEHLERFPPQDEVELKSGPEGEGTSWSCSHGVGRWVRDCGCNTGQHPDWNQKWRGPLRAAFDALRDELAPFFEEQAASIFRDPWAARDAYIDVILQRDSETVDRFFAEHGHPGLDEEKRVRGLKLLEMQRHAMLMYTSCGWFFDDLSGIETVQVIRYAARAVQLAESLGLGDVEQRLISRLKEARSNLPEVRDGATIYERQVKPSMVTFSGVVSHFAIRSTFESFRDSRKIYHYTITRAESQRLPDGPREKTVGLVEVQSGTTLEKRTYGYLLAAQPRSQRFDCWVRTVTAETSLNDLVRAAEESGVKKRPWSRTRYTLLDMLQEDRERIMKILLEKRTSGIAAVFAKIYRRHSGLMKQLRRLGIEIPAELRLPAEQVLSKRLNANLAQAPDVAAFLSQKEALRIVEEARLLGLDLDTSPAAAQAQRLAEQSLHELRQTVDADRAHELAKLFGFARDLGLRLHEGRIQDQLFEVLQQQVSAIIDSLVQGGENGSAYRFVSEVLRIAYQFNFDIRPYKERLEPYEAGLNQNPAYWP
jgi:alpha-amylase/alpha-mannosidase (GH57 family)